MDTQSCCVFLPGLEGLTSADGLARNATAALCACLFPSSSSVRPYPALAWTCADSCVGGRILELTDSGVRAERRMREYDIAAAAAVAVGEIQVGATVYFGRGEYQADLIVSIIVAFLVT